MVIYEKKAFFNPFHLNLPVALLTTLEKNGRKLISLINIFNLRLEIQFYSLYRYTFHNQYQLLICVAKYILFYQSIL